MFEKFKRALGMKLSSEEAVREVYSKFAYEQQLYQSAELRFDIQRLAPPNLVKDLFCLSNDVTTTYHLLRILVQRHFAEGILERVDPTEVTSRMGVSAAKNDAEDQYQVAKNFCDEIVGLCEIGTISQSPAVGQFVEDNLSAILSAYARYSMQFSLDN